jgi:hypothetical protein
MPLPRRHVQDAEAERGEDDGLSVVEFTGIFYSALCAIEDH